ncbi:MAG: hypothetical protein EOP50_08615 [Sphingobacteriales bacterium]|nr:MAG: hypothetical protein EOP50_08615 [Sphingobacteriales bacterium]
MLRSYAPDSVTVVVEFSEPLDSLAGAVASYSIEGGPAIQAMQTLPPLFGSVELRLAAPLQRGKVYQLRAEGARDCSGMELAPGATIPVALPEPPEPGSIVINELLYSPQTGGSEYVELLTRDRTLDLSQIYIATRSATGTVGTPRRLSALPLQAFPGEYHVFAPDAADVSNRYFIHRPEWLHNLTGMPALPDEGASLLLLDRQGNVLEEVPYSPKWQFALINDAHGVALERLDPYGSGAERSNWHSAAATAGFGTPTARNSQYRGGNAEGTLTVTPAVFSPDNDGFDDVAVITYEMEESGYLANISIFDALGRPVRRLVRNGLLGRSGRFSWDGLDEQGRPLQVGTYVLFAELLNLDGKRKVFKRAVTIAKLLR